MKRICTVIASLMIAISLAGCSQSSSEKLVLTGSSTVAPLVAEIAKRFEALNPDVRIDVQTGGSSRGVNDARKGLADVGMVSRGLKVSEADLRTNTIAWDGITLILHKDNPVQSLSKNHIVDVYTGKIKNWKDLGGVDSPIVVVNKAEGRSTLELFLKHFGLKNSEVNADIIIGDNQQGLKTVEGNPLAIGYVSIGAAAYEAENGASIKLLPVDGVQATLKNVELGVFPIARPLNLVTTENSTPLAKRFIEYAQSQDVGDLVQEQFFIAANANK